MLSFQLVQISFEGSFTAAGNHIVDRVVFQIAESCGIAQTTGEEVLVDTQHLRTHRAGSFGSQSLQMNTGPALHGGAGNVFTLRHAAAADAVKVLLANAAAKRFTGPEPGQNTGETLPETALT